MIQRNLEKVKKEKEKQKRNNITNLDENIEKVYTNIKSVPSYSKKIIDFLRKKESSSLFRQVRHKFPRRKIKSYFPYQMMMTDTINYRNYSDSNRNYKYIMVLIDVFSKMAWTFPMQRMKEADSMIAMESMLKQVPENPHVIISDRGTEYYNSKMKTLFERLGIKHYSLQGKHKACIAERFIKTIKGRLEKYFWETKTRNWIDVLQSFTSNYNSTYHRSIKMSPIEVNDDNRKIVFKNLYPKLTMKINPRLKIGDQVRLLRTKGLFEKGYSRSWTTSLFTVTKTFSEGTVDFYSIRDSSGIVLPRKKYYWELNLVSRDDN